MSQSKYFVCGMVVVPLVLAALGVVYGSSVSTPNNFVPNTPALAGEVNANFAAHEAAINDNDARITALATRRISFTSGALTEAPASGVITHDPTGNGLRWMQDFGEAIRVNLRRPPDYGGGDVQMTLTFRKTSGNAGVVDFFIRPNSFDVGEVFTDIVNLNAPGVDVTGGADRTFYKQVFTIPASRLMKEIWDIRAQREGAESTYADDIILSCIDLEYSLN